METSHILYVFAMLLVTLFAFCLLMFVLKKLKSINPKFSDGIKIQGGASLGNKARLVMVESENIKILLGVTEQQINTIHIFDQPNKSHDDLNSFSNQLESRLNG